jgi:hypothetical protein
MNITIPTSNNNSNSNPPSPSPRSGNNNNNSNKTCKVVGCKLLCVSNSVYCTEHKKLFQLDSNNTINDPKHSRNNSKSSGSNSKNNTLTKALDISASNTNNLLEETRSSWSTANKVVFKDVPRLAKRISIQTSNGIIVLSGRNTNINNLHQMLTPKPETSITNINQADKLIELSVNTSKNNDSTNQDKNLDDNKDNDQTVNNVNATTENNDKKSDESKVNDNNNVNNTNDKPHHNPTRRLSLTSTDIKEEVLPAITSWQAITNVVLCVAEQLEESIIVDMAKKQFADYANKIENSNGADLEGALSDIFSNAIGLKSSTFSVFRAIHQSILFPAIFHLKTKLYNQVGAMKDVRGEDGWRVIIYIAPQGNISVTHTRWEQSLHEDNSPDKFHCQWEIRLSFDRDMIDLRAVFLRIMELKFSPSMKNERKAEILNILKGGGYIV